MVPRAKQSHGYFPSLQIIQLLMDTGYRQKGCGWIFQPIWQKSFPGGPNVNYPPANAGDGRDTGWIPGLGRLPGGGHGNHASILAWRTPWTEEPQIGSDQSLSRVRLFATPWTAARQASLSISNSRSSLRPTSIESVMPSMSVLDCCH